jgi:S-adenosyl methyltransferase
VQEVAKDPFTSPSAARMYDYALGGKDNYQVDRDAADRVMELYNYKLGARVNRKFMERMVRSMIRDEGIHQFLDIGTGIPTQPNLHQVAQELVPHARVMYVDNDPIVLAHAHALMVGTPEGVVDFVDADFSDPARVLDALTQLGTFDLSKPVVLSLIAVLHLVPDDRDPHRTVATLMDAFAPGSYLAISHATADYQPEAIGQIERDLSARGVPFRPRTLAEFSRFFDGFTVVEPGLVPPHRWRPIESALPPEADAEISLYAGVARKTPR